MFSFGKSAKEARAATTLQRHARGRQARARASAIREDAEQEQAAIKIQALMRGRSDRKFVSDEKHVERHVEFMSSPIIGNPNNPQLPLNWRLFELGSEVNTNAVAELTTRNGPQDIVDVVSRSTRPSGVTLRVLQSMLTLIGEPETKVMHWEHCVKKLKMTEVRVARARVHALDLRDVRGVV